MKCLHAKGVTNRRPWPALGADVGECVECSSTVVVLPELEPKVTTTFVNSKTYLNRVLEFLTRALGRAGLVNL